MPPRPEAIVLSIGEEVIGGDIVDSNAAELSRRLAALGIATRGFRAVGDVEAEIAERFREASERADVVVSTGGLGPTRDDLTRQGLAKALGEPLVEDAAALEQVRAIFARYGRPMSDSNRLQALRPESASILENPVGTAPGLFARLGRALVFVLPGIPFEMKRMFDDGVVAHLRVHGLAPGAPPRRRLRCHGIAESVAGERIAEWMGEDKDPYVGVTVSGGVLTVSVRARTAGDQARDAVDRIAAVIESVLAPHVFGREDDTLESVLVALARAKGVRIACAESCTGGRIAAAITAVPGSSAVFAGGVVAYANEAKIALLDVPADEIARHGAVSGEVARAMARGAAARLSSEVAVSATGIAGPDGGTEAKPVGLVHVGIHAFGRDHSLELRFVGDREAVQSRSARTALDLAIRAIRDRR